MAQATDYNLANQSGASFRAELNTILAAVVSQNSGSTAPTTTYAYQLWIDTGASPNPLLKLRNGANSAWITIGDVTVANLGLALLASPTFTGTVTIPTATITTGVGIPLGTVSSPTIYFTGDTNTGIYSPAANQLSFATDGTERLRLDDSGQIEAVSLGTAAAPTYTFNTDPNTGIYSPGADQVAISTNGTGQLFIGSTGQVGIGKVPTQLFDIQASGNAQMRVTTTDISGGNLGSFVGRYTGGGGGTASTVVLRAGDGYTSVGASTNSPLLFINNETERMRLDTSGRLGLGTSSPDALLTVNGIGAFGAGAVTTPSIAATGDLNTGFWFPAADTIAASTGGSERARIDSSGRLLVGTSSARAIASATNSVIQSETTGATGLNLSLVANRDDAAGAIISLGKSRGATVGSNTIVNSGDTVGQLRFAGADGTDIQSIAASIEAQIDATPGADDMPGRLVFSTTADGASSPTERMRIQARGDVLIATAQQDIAFVNGVGASFSATGNLELSQNATHAARINRKTDDGNLVLFTQDGTIEGTISVSGTTVSYNGAHLSRWSQLPGGATREEILRGSVLSNIDEMCAWGEEDNEQLNRMKVSDVEGDPNVAGVFQAWDDDDDTYTDDFYCAMTGDFIIRIAEGVTVQRGDLLMSAGDGTAKPQDDDIIRSKTIAKVTSTHVTCIYDDGSYCVPCVLMAC